MRSVISYAMFFQLWMDRRTVEEKRHAHSCTATLCPWHLFLGCPHNIKYIAMSCLYMFTPDVSILPSFVRMSNTVSNKWFKCAACHSGENVAQCTAHVDSKSKHYPSPESNTTGLMDIILVLGVNTVGHYSGSAHPQVS